MNRNQTQIVETQMEAAREKDERNGRKDRIVCGTCTCIILCDSMLIIDPPNPQTTKDGKLRVVRFHILRSLPASEKDHITVTRECDLSIC